jgi:uncharacterized protein YcnI
MVRGGKVKDSYKKADSDISKGSTSVFEIEANLEPDDEDFAQAQEDIKNYQLEDFDFSNIDELYLDDEEDGVIYGLDNI